MKSIQERSKLVWNSKEGEAYQCVDWSPDGSKLVVGSYDGWIEVLTVGGQRLWEKKLNVEIFCVSWSPDGKMIVSSSSDENQSIRIWNSTSAELVSILSGINKAFYLSWSPNSQQIVFDTDHSIETFDVFSGNRAVKVREESPALVFCVSWEPNGRSLAYGIGAPDGGKVGIADVESGRVLHQLERHTGAIRCICWSPNRQYVASGAEDQSIRIWNVSNGKPLIEVLDHEDFVLSLSWSYEGKTLASGSKDKTLRLWDVETGKELLCLNTHQSHVRSVTFSPQGGLLASVGNDGTLRIWDVSDFVPACPSVSIQSTLVDYITRQAATVRRQPQTTTVERFVPQFPGAHGKYLGALEGVKTAPDISLYPNGTKLAVGHRDGKLRVWNLTNGKIIFEQDLDQGTRSPKSISVSPNGEKIATISPKSKVQIWNAASGDLIQDFNSESTRRPTWSPDSRYLASTVFGSTDLPIQIRDVTSGHCLREYAEHANSYIQGLDWSSDGRTIASGDNDGEIHVWIAQAGKCLYKSVLHKDVVWKLSFSPNYQYLLVGYSDGLVLVLEASLESILLKIAPLDDSKEKSRDGTTALAWSPDDQLFAMAPRQDRLIRIWNLEKKTVVEQFTVESSCYLLDWSADGAFLVGSVGDDQKVHFWDTRHLVKHQTFVASHSIPPAHQALPLAFSQLFRIGLSVPLNLFQDCLSWTRGKVTDSCPEALSTSPALKALRALHWPETARIGLVALMLHEILFPDWQAPVGISPSEIREALTVALQGKPIPPEAPPIPVSALQAALEKIDDRVITLLQLLGPEAVAADPGLPLRLLPQGAHLPALNEKQRRLLGLRVRLSETRAQSVGKHQIQGGNEIGGVDMGPLQNNWQALLPSQLVLPQSVQAYRHLRGELLFRAKTVAEPPRLRPTVILLDLSPATFGPIESVTRLAASIVCQSLHRALIPVTLITPGETSPELHPIENSTDQLKPWTERTLASVDASQCLHTAQAVRANLESANGLEPITLLLTHPYFAAEESLPKIPHLCALFVQYPGQNVHPSIADSCDRWVSVEAKDIKNLDQVLGELLG